MFGYWMCSSNQLLSNDYLYKREMISSTPKTDHLYYDPFTPAGWKAPAWPLLLSFFVFAFLFFFGKAAQWVLLKCFKSYHIGDI